MIDKSALPDSRRLASGRGLVAGVPAVAIAIAVAAGFCAARMCAAADQPPPGGPAEAAVFEITQDTVLDPAKTYGRLVIQASGITVNGRGAWLIGPGRACPKTSSRSPWRPGACPA